MIKNNGFLVMQLLVFRYTREVVLMSLITLLCMMLFASCAPKSREQSDEDEDEYEHPGPPAIMVCFVPLDGVNAADVKKLSEDFYSNFASGQWEPYLVQVLNASKIPDSCYNSKHTRYSATKVISFQENRYAGTARKDAEADCPEGNWAYYVIGVTDRDISTQIHGKDDYGILGLSYLNSLKVNSSIISTYRLRRKKDLWKLATHEFCHGFYNAPHCPDEHCIMADAKGGNPHFEVKDSLCTNCRAICLYGDRLGIL